MTQHLCVLAAVGTNIENTIYRQIAQKATQVILLPDGKEIIIITHEPLENRVEKQAIYDRTLPAGLNCLPRPGHPGFY